MDSLQQPPSSFSPTNPPSASPTVPSGPPRPSTTPDVESLQRKRSIATSAESPDNFNRRKTPKVSRACDLCKAKKAKCSGTKPCSSCAKKGLVCLYDANYSRGRPPTPPSGFSNGMMNVGRTPLQRRSQESLVPSRASPELEIEGQYADPTSGLSFLHRAWSRLSKRNSKTIPGVTSHAEDTHQGLMTAGDKPFQIDKASVVIPDRERATELFSMYFDICMATYHFLHRATTQHWMEIFMQNHVHGKPLHHEIGHARAAIILTIFAIATFHREKARGVAYDEAASLKWSDDLFFAAAQLSDHETGFPTIESVQARLIQVLYLLTTSRMNQAWYTFGTSLQIVSALGLHRRVDRKRGSASSRNAQDYIQTQCRKRTFWVAYILDIYLGVIFGRPRHYHDEDIDQEFPDRVNDEDMSSAGPLGDYQDDCRIDALVFHARLARIIGDISRQVYTIRPMPEAERVAATRKFGQQIREWRAGLPPFLGTIKPSSLIENFRRQATVLKLAHSHAILLANRPFLLGTLSRRRDTEGLSSDNISECIMAAQTILEIVDRLARDGPLFNAFWWTHYLTFCALAVVYVWAIQQHRMGSPDNIRLSALAERCMKHLAEATASNSPSRRYSIILQELQRQAKPHAASTLQDGALHSGTPESPNGQNISFGLGNPSGFSAINAIQYNNAIQPLAEDIGLVGAYNLLDGWQTTDWLDLDSSAFGPFSDFEDISTVSWPTTANKMA